jgi:hypothetical protein
MVEIHVALADPLHVQGLLGSLAGLFSGGALAYDEVRNEICISSEWESRDVNQVISAFESWLATDGLGSSAKLSIGEGTYEMVPSACTPARRPTPLSAPAPRP